jgi:hypothetical protein
VSDETQAAVDAAVAYRAATATVTGRVSAVLAMLWRELDAAGIGPGWARRLPEAVGAFTAGQSAVAGMADGYVARTLTAQGATPAAAGVAVDAAAFAGDGASGIGLDTLLAIPAARADAAVAAGMAPGDALRAGEAALRMYAATEMPDAGTLSVQASMVAHHAQRYVRVVGARCCSRCALLSGRIYKVRAFERHPRCSCVCLPVAVVGLADIPSPIDLYRQGRITDLTQAEREALDHGADISQVVNAKQGMYVAGGRSYTATGTTRRSVGGARMLQARIDQAAGTPQARYTNFTVSRAASAAAAAKYGPLMSRGLPYQRRGPAGGTELVQGQFRVPGRPTVAQIMRDHASREDRETALLNYGYLIRERDAATSTAALDALFRAS